MSANPGGKKRAEAAGEDPHPRRRISECNPDAARGGAHGPYGKRRGSGRNGPFRPAVLYTDASRKHASLQKQSGDVNKTVFRAEKKRLGSLEGEPLLMSARRGPLTGNRMGVRRAVPALPGYNRGVFPAAEGRIRGNPGDHIIWKEGYS